MGAFPNLSRNVPFCPRLSSFVPICPRSGPQEGQKRTNGDKTGHFGTNWETPPFSIYPHLAPLKLTELPLLSQMPRGKRYSSRFCRADLGQIFGGSEEEDIRKLARKFLSEFLSEFSCKFFGHAFSAPPPKKFTPELVSIPLQCLISEPNNCFSRRCLLTGEINKK